MHREFYFVVLENSETPSTSTVLQINNQEDNMFCARSFYNLVQTFPEALHSDQQGDEDYTRSSVQISSEGAWPFSLFPHIVSWDSFGPWTCAHF